MSTLQDWLREKRAKDVMTRDVAVISYHAPLEEAARLFREKHISGAPVVDDKGNCVGVISASDVIRFDVELGGEHEESDYGPQPDELVGRRMSRGVVGVHEDTRLSEVLDALSDAQIHRVVVVDKDAQRVIGLVSTTDIVTALHEEITAVLGQ